MSAAQATSWALITGASDGIGRAIAVELARQGVNLVLVARTQSRLDRVEADLQTRFSVHTRTVCADFADPHAAEQLDRAIDALDVDITTGVLAAGYGSIGRFERLPLVVETAMVQVNCASVVELSARLLARFRRRGHGQLVLFGSVVGYSGAGFSTTYAATKNFVQAFAEGLQQEVAGSGVSVLCVAPGPTRSGFADRSGMQMGATVPAETVAQATVRALGRNGTIKPGGLTKLLHYALAMLGRRGRTMVLSQVMRGMDPMRGVMD